MDFTSRGEHRQEHSDGRIRMPFGKHKGTLLDDVPDSYLIWVLDNIDMKNRPTLEEAIRGRLKLPPRVDPQANEHLEVTIKAWFRGLALDFHPDRRGSHEGMIAINEAHHRLRKMLKL